MGDDKTNFSNIQVEDGEGGFSFGKGDGLGRKYIILEQFRRCVVEGSKGTSYIDKNQIDLFISSIKLVEGLLNPTLEKYEDLLRNMKEVNQKICSVQQQYNEDKKNIIKRCNNDKKLNFNKCLSELEQRYEKKLWSVYLLKFNVISYLVDKVNYYEEASF